MSETLDEMMTRRYTRNADDIGRILATPGVCAGKPRISGTRIPTRIVWGCHRDNLDVDAILAMYPSLTFADVTAAIAFEQGRRWKKGETL